MSFARPSPARQRLYTTTTSYLNLFRDLALGKIETGSDLETLESSFAERIGSPQAIAVNQARLGIYLAIKALVRGEKRRVLLSPFTIFDVVNMVICAGGEPKFVDIVPGSYTIDKNGIQEALGPGVAAVLITHTHEMCADLLEIQGMCREAGVSLIEDCAVALGTSFQEKALGTFGDVGIFSFGLYKNVCGFYGGMVVTSDRCTEQKIRGELMSFQGIKAGSLLRQGVRGLVTDFATSPLLFKALTSLIFRYGLLYDIEVINRWTRNDPNARELSELPQNYRVGMSQTQARLISAGIERVETDHQDRLSLATYYWDNLQGHAELKLPSRPGDLSGSYHNFPIQLDRSKELHHHLARNGRDCSQYYYRNCASLACFGAYNRSCPEAERAASNILLLPTYPGYSLVEAARNIEVIESFFQEFSTS